MLLVHAADYGGPYAGSFVPMIAAVGREAQARGWDFRAVFTPVAEGREWMDLLDGLDVRVMPPSAMRPTLQAADVIHTHFSALDLMAAEVGRATGAAVFWHVHTVLDTAWKAQLRNRVRFSWYARGVREILCVSPSIAADVRRRWGRRATYLPNAIDAERFVLPTAEVRDKVRADLGIDAAAAVVLHFGRLVELKGLDIMLDAMADLPGVTALVVGAPEEARALAAGVSARVVFAEPRVDVRPFYAAADVFASTSRGEGMPYSVLEALSSGLPTALTPIPGHVAVADGAPSCAVAASMAPVDVADAIRRACADAVTPADRHAWVADHLDVRPWAASLCDRYEAARG